MSLKTMAETVLVVGSTGNIGFSAVHAALSAKRNVLAVVRNQNSADKLVKYIGSADGITFTQADVLSDTGVKGVVDQVRAGKLPAFQHVWSSGESPFWFLAVRAQLTAISLQWVASMSSIPSKVSAPRGFVKT